MNNIKIIALVITTYILCFGSSANATTYAMQSLKSLTSLSTDVVQAKVASVESRLANDKTSIYTRVVISVTEPIVGERKSDELVVYLPGGTVDGMSTVILGAPQLVKEEEFVFMLAAVPQGMEGAESDGLPAFNLVGLSQGLFNIELDANTKDTMVKSHVLNHFDIDSLQEGDQGPPGGVEGLRMDQFKQQIKKLYESPDAPEEVIGDSDEGEEITKENKLEKDDAEANPDHSEEGKADGKIDEDIGKSDKEGEEGTGSDSYENTDSMEKPQ